MVRSNEMRETRGSEDQVQGSNLAGTRRAATERTSSFLGSQIRDRSSWPSSQPMRTRPHIAGRPLRETVHRPQLWLKQPVYDFPLTGEQTRPNVREWHPARGTFPGILQLALGFDREHSEYHRNI